MPDPADRPWVLRPVPLALGLLVVVVAVLYVGAYVLVGPGIARGTTVLGVAIGGRSPAAATRVLERELADESRAPIPVRIGDVDSTVAPRRAGLSLDAAATVDAARTRSWNPVDLVVALIGGAGVAPVAAVDRAALGAEVARLADTVDREPVDGAVELSKSEVVRVEAKEGITLDRPRTMDRLRAAYLTPRHLRGADGKRVRLPAKVVEPAVKAAEVERAVTEIAEPAVSAAVPLTVEGTTAAIQPEAIAQALSFTADADGVLQPKLNGRRLHAAVADELAEVEQPGQDATFDVSSGSPQLVPAKQGKAVRPATLAAAVLPALTLTGSDRAVTVPLEVSAPDVTTATARGLGVRELVASFTTYYPSDFAPRLTNIHRAADLLNRTLVLPGEEFSFNGTVGERTEARGFAAGIIINNGKLEVDFGGGVSQLVTTTFNAFYFAGLDFVEYHPHSFYISRYPEGREATVAWGSKDLRVKNDDDEHAVFVTTSYTNGSVTVRVWGTDRYRIESVKSGRTDFRSFRTVYDPRPTGLSEGNCVPSGGVLGFKVVVTRLFYAGGTKVRSEDFRTSYNPENQVVCGRSGPPEPTKKPKPKPTTEPTQST